MVEEIAQMLATTDGEEYSWKLRTTLKKAKTVKTNMSPAELRATSQLGKYISVTILPPGKWNATVIMGTKQT